MMPGQLLLYAKIGAVALFLVLVFGTGHRIGKNGVQADWDRDKVQMLAAQAALVAERGKEIAELRLKQDAINLKVSDEHSIALGILEQTYNDRIAAVRASGGLRIPRAACSPVGTTTEAASAGGVNETTSPSVALPRETERRLFDLAKEADELLETTRSCQSWIRAQGFYGAALPHQ